MSVAPTWERIPFHVKEDIVQLLDYKSRFRLRVCSKSDLNLVDACPIFLEQIELYATPYKNAPNFPHVLYINKTIKIRENIVDHFFAIFNHNGSRVNKLVFGLDRGNHTPNAFVSQLAVKSGSLKECVKIKAKEVHFKSQGLLDEGCSLIFNVLDPHELFLISCPSWFRLDVMNEFIQSDVWKRAKKISLGDDYCGSKLPITHFLHCEKLQYTISTLSLEDAWKLIKSFITRDNISHGFGFSVNFYNEITEEQLVAKFEVQSRKVPMVHRP